MKLQRVAVAAATAAGGMALMFGTAHAVECTTDNPYCGDVLGNNGSQAPVAAAPAVVQQGHTDPVLALTGADVTEIAVIGVGLVSLGTVMVRRSRKVSQKV